MNKAGQAGRFTLDEQDAGAFAALLSDDGLMSANFQALHDSNNFVDSPPVEI